MRVFFNQRINSLQIGHDLEAIWGDAEKILHLGKKWENGEIYR